VKNLTNVTFVKKIIPDLEDLKFIKELIQVKNLLNVKFAEQSLQKMEI
jgi:hypothetical protein